jgi:hypothetical protein
MTIWCGLFYFWPRRWMSSYDFMNEDNINRLHHIDAVGTATYDVAWLYHWGHWQRNFTPHRFEWSRKHREFHFAPDSKVQPITITLNRENKCFDHSWRGYGNDDNML